MRLVIKCTVNCFCFWLTTQQRNFRFCHNSTHDVCQHSIRLTDNFIYCFSSIMIRNQGTNELFSFQRCEEVQGWSEMNWSGLVWYFGMVRHGHKQSICFYAPTSSSALVQTNNWIMPSRARIPQSLLKFEKRMIKFKAKTSIHS